MKKLGAVGAALILGSIVAVWLRPNHVDEPQVTAPSEPPPIRQLPAGGAVIAEREDTTPSPAPGQVLRAKDGHSITACVNGESVPSFLVRESTAVDSRKPDGDLVTSLVHDIDAIQEAETIAIVVRGRSFIAVGIGALSGNGVERIEVPPSRSIACRFLNEPPGLRDRVQLVLQVMHSDTPTPVLKKAWVVLGRSMHGVSLANGDTQSIPIDMLGGGELILVARASAEGPAHHIKRTFSAVDASVEFDLSQLAFCVDLATVHAEVLVDGGLRAAASSMALLRAEDDRVVKSLPVTSVGGSGPIVRDFVGIRPGRYLLQIVRSNGGVVRLPEFDVAEPDCRVAFAVSANCALSVHVRGDGAWMEKSFLRCWDASGRILSISGTAANTGANRTWSIDGLQAGTVYVQAWVPEAKLASRIMEVALREGDSQSIALDLSRATRVIVDASRVSPQKFADLTAADGSTSRVGLVAVRSANFMIPVGQYRVRCGDRVIQADLSSGADVRLDLSTR